jgi:cytochrome c peroxidase
MFHRNDGGTVRLACASCHGQGRDDGHVWNFNIGPRRTQNISNDVMTTAPFHWDGKMKDLGMIMHEVFEKRMGGRPQGQAHVDAFSTWLSKMPAMSNPVTGEESQIAAGEELFQGKAGCNGCHTGAKFTNNQNKDVGTGQAFQVPSLVGVAMRAPYMHDGCATTLKDRFDPTLMSKDGKRVCGGDMSDGANRHGNVSALSEAEVDDLVAYLESL